MAAPRSELALLSRAGGSTVTREASLGPGEALAPWCPSDYVAGW